MRFMRLLDAIFLADLEFSIVQEDDKNKKKQLRRRKAIYEKK
jgi:hypothetical protein